jgi:CheY-like chemotaxis protein
MDEEVKAHIFDPFFTTKLTGQGTGLGLATVAELVHEMKGTIEVDSTPGRGSVFTLYLPAAEKRLPPAPAVGPALILPGGSETILLVEDAEPVRTLMTRVLTMQGYTVLAAASGPEAVALVESQGAVIDLLITDIVMSGMNGWQLADRLSVGRPGLRLLFMSGNAAGMADRPDQPVKAAGFLQKPFTPEVLLRKVREILGPARA